MKWEELSQLYREHLLALGRSRPTVYHRQWELKRFFRFCERGRLKLDGVTAQTIQAFHEELLQVPGEQGKIWCKAFARSALRTVLMFFDWALESSFLMLRPAPEMTFFKKPLPPPQQLLTTEEVLQILQAPDPSTTLGQRDRAILELFYSTGIRRRECHRLDLADLDLVRRQLMVRRGKGGRSRILSVGDHLAEVLQDYLDRVRPLLRPQSAECALFVSSHNGGRLGFRSIWHLMKVACKGAGFKDVHGLRHAFASQPRGHHR
jgi:integrase/recombinase XerD